MNSLVSFCKKVQLSRVIAVFAAGFILLLNVACSNGNAVGARPANPPVQMGGQNNPHKAGGDGYNDYQMSTDPAVAKRDRASSSAFSQLVATANANGSFLDRTAQSVNATLKSSEATRDPVKEAQQVPERPQKVIDRSDPNVKILEKAGKTFKDAAKHLTGEADKSIEQSGVVQQDMNH